MEFSWPLMTGRSVYTGILASLVIASSATAELATPIGQVLLNVTGNISVTNNGDSAAFDLAMLEALPTTSYTTTTIWTEGEQEFVGVPLQTIIDLVGASGSVITATAINDYAINIPFEDETNADALIAFKRNGKTMSVRDKGPLWVIYPYDANPSFQAEVYYSRSIWQLDRIDIAH